METSISGKNENILVVHSAALLPFSTREEMESLLECPEQLSLILLRNPPCSYHLSWLKGSMISTAGYFLQAAVHIDFSVLSPVWRSWPCVTGGHSPIQPAVAWG